MLLPLGYVAVPYLLGIFAVRSTITPNDLLLLGGLYAGFIGRIVLKDFRDVRGDALFGKRTFLVRHGRRATCIFSAAFLVLGVGVLPFVRDLTVAMTARVHRVLGRDARPPPDPGALDECSARFGAHRGDCDPRSRHARHALRASRDDDRALAGGPRPC